MCLRLFFSPEDGTDLMLYLCMCISPRILFFEQGRYNSGCLCLHSPTMMWKPFTGVKGFDFIQLLISYKEEAQKREQEEQKRRENEMVFRAWLQKKKGQVQEEKRIQRAKEMEDLNSRVRKNLPTLEVQVRVTG